MTSQEKFDIVLTGIIFAYDTDTGDVVHIDEIHEEVADGEEEKLRRAPCQADCDTIRELAAADHPRRKIDVLAVAAADEVEVPSAGRVRFHVDPVTKRMRTTAMPAEER